MHSSHIGKPTSLAAIQVQSLLVIFGYDGNRLTPASP
jgi:hypothetical protein